jgi:ABC-type amino acid transport substrate-binding protein
MKKLISTLFLCWLATDSFAQAKLESFRVATRLIKPFVFEEQGRLTGFSVDLWQEITKQMNVNSEFAVKPTVRELLASVNATRRPLASPRFSGCLPASSSSPTSLRQ